MCVIFIYLFLLMTRYSSTTYLIRNTVGSKVDYICSRVNQVKGSINALVCFRDPTTLVLAIRTNWGDDPLNLCTLLYTSPSFVPQCTVCIRDWIWNRSMRKTRFIDFCLRCCAMLPGVKRVALITTSRAYTTEIALSYTSNWITNLHLMIWICI